MRRQSTLTCEGNIYEEFLVSVALNKLHSVKARLPRLEDSLATVLHLLVEAGEVVHVDLLVERVRHSGLLSDLTGSSMITASSMTVTMTSVTSVTSSHHHIFS